MRRLVPSVLALSLLAACGGDDEGSSATPTCRFLAPAAGAVVSGTVEVRIEGPDGLELLAPLSDTSNPGQVATALGPVPVQERDGALVGSWDTAHLDGPHRLQAAGEDGGKSYACEVAVTVDNAAPALSFGLPRFSVLAGAADVAFVADDPHLTSVRLLDRDVVIHEAAASGSFAWDTTVVEDGVHRLALEATDAAGHVARLEGFPVVVVNHGEVAELQWLPEAAVTIPENYESVEIDVRALAGAKAGVRRLIAWLTWDSPDGWLLELAVGQGICPHRGISYEAEESREGEVLVEVERSELPPAIVDRFPEADRESSVFPVNDDPNTFGKYFAHVKPMEPAEHVGETLPISVGFVLLFEEE